MHHAPKVHWQVTRLRVHACVLSMLWLAGLIACGAWWLTGGQNVTQHVWVWVVVLACAVVATRDWRATVPGTLVWDGKGWAWLPEGQGAIDGTVAVSIDFQRLMLVRFAGASGGVRWLWVEPGVDMVQWRALRRALFCGQASAALQAPAPGGAQLADPASR